jgi:competence protein ComGC
MRTKEMRGITLIALVITIVIIMILAGVTINLVVGNNNLFDKAKSTQKIQTVAGIKEALELEKVDIQVESKKVDLDTYLEQISTGKKNYNLSSKEKVDEKNAEIIVNDEYKFLVKDKENGDVEIIYDGIAKADDLTISSKNGTYTYPNSGTFEVTNNTSRGELTVSSDASNIATASIDGNTITVKPETVAGKANIIVKSAANGEYAENKVIHVATVKNGTIELEAIPYDGVYDGQAHNAFTSISTNPSDAKLEYSLDGNEYNEEMPTITNTSEFTVTVKASKEGYKTQITTETVKVSRAEGKLKLSATSGTITYPSNATFTVSGNTGTLSVSSNNNNIATASVSGNTVTVKSGTTAGKATITVTSAEASNYNEKSATYTATVNNGTISLSATPYNGTYDGKAHNALTNVSANPGDAKIEYSINGRTYNTTMPTITNVSSFTVTIKASKVGYKTQTRTETVKVSRAEGKLKLSATSGTITYPSNATFTVSGNTGTLSVSSNNNNIATASVSGNTVTVKSGTTAGKATITVTSAEASNYNEKSATYTATVNNGTISLSATPYTGTYDGKAHNAITKVTVTPSDAKIEYSTDGTNYSTTMPTITNTSSFTVTVRASKAGYKTQSTTQTVKVNKAAGTLTLSATSGTINYPNSTTFTVSGNTGSITASSSNTKVATVTVSGNTVTVKSVGVGSATITVKSASNTNYNEKTATYSVTVKYQTFTGNSGVGYYADTDGDGTPDGIIFADFKNGGSGSWGGTNYTISTVTGLKEYYISQTNYNGPFGTKNVLSARGSGNSRFNVMALSDYNNSSTYAFANAQSITSGEWKTPTIATWSTFAGQLKITNSNYGEYGLERIYWSSTAFTGFGSNHSYYISFYAVMSNGIEARSNKYPVRLVRTF